MDHIFDQKVDKIIFPSLRIAESHIPKNRLKDVFYSGIFINPNSKPATNLTKNNFMKNII